MKRNYQYIKIKATRKYMKHKLDYAPKTGMQFKFLSRIFSKKDLNTIIELYVQEKIKEHELPKQKKVKIQPKAKLIIT